jgi:hypothetical protein
MDPTTIAVILERGGLPGFILIGLFLIWKYAPERKTPEPAQQVVDAVNALRTELADLKAQTIDRLARVETEIKNIKERE